MKYLMGQCKRRKRRSGYDRVQLIALDDSGNVLTRVTISEAKARDPAEVLKAMAKLQQKLITREKAADKPPQDV